MAPISFTFTSCPPVSQRSLSFPSLLFKSSPHLTVRAVDLRRWMLIGWKTVMESEAPLLTATIWKRVSDEFWMDDLMGGVVVNMKVVMRCRTVGFMLAPINGLKEQKNNNSLQRHGQSLLMWFKVAAFMFQCRKVKRLLMDFDHMLRKRS